MSTVLYFGNDWSAENRTSSHHIARRLAEQHEVYYIECPGMRAPTGSGRDVRKIAQKLWKGLRGPRTALPGLKVMTLLQIPLHRFALLRLLNARLVYWSVRWLMWRNRIRRPIAWFVAPHVASLIGRLNESLSVYYVTDDHASMPGIDVDSMCAMDQRLTEKADIVFVVSENLFDAKSRINPNTHHSPHGVDVEHFGLAQCDGTAIPDDIKHLPRPIVGFFGLMEGRFDLDLVAYAARERPQWSFLMIGHVGVPKEKVPDLPNLHFIGKRPYQQLPEYGRHFAAAILPSKASQQAFYGNPLKLREYLAMGKPVVSIGTPEAEKFADVVEIARNRDDFLAKLDKVVGQPDSPEAVQQRLNRVASSSWEARVAEVLRVIQLKVKDTPPHAVETSAVAISRRRDPMRPS